MKKLFVYSVFILTMSTVLSLLVEISLVYSFGRGINIKIDGHSHTYSRLLEADTTSGNYKYLAIGSSHCYRSFTTDSSSIFNLGSSAQSHFQTLFLTKKYLKKIKPEIVIYEIYPDIFYGNLSLESQIDLNYSQRNFQCLEHLFTYKSFENVRSVMNSCMLDLFDMKNSAATVSRLRDTTNTYIRGGYVRRTETMTGLSCTSDKRIDLDRFDVKQLESFLETVQYIRENEVSLKLVIAPYPNVPVNINEYVQLIESITKLTVDDYSKWYCEAPDEYFFDEGHLNYKGARLFTKNILEGYSRGKVNY